MCPHPARQVGSEPSIPKNVSASQTGGQLPLCHCSNMIKMDKFVDVFTNKTSKQSSKIYHSICGEQKEDSKTDLGRTKLPLLQNYPTAVHYNRAEHGAPLP